MKLTARVLVTGGVEPPEAVKQKTKILASILSKGQPTRLMSGQLPRWLRLILKRYLLIILLIPALFATSCTEEIIFQPLPHCEGGLEIDQEPSWSPDGRTIAYFSLGDTLQVDFGLLLIDTNGNNRRLFIQGWALSPDWSPDGNWIVFAAGQIYKIKVNGDSATQLTTEVGNFFPSWSPDGEWIVYDSDYESSGSMHYVWKMRKDGTEKRRLAYTPEVGEIRTASWSPDGKKIVHMRFIGVGTSEIFSMDSAGNNPLRLTHDGRDDISPKYSSDGTLIVYYSVDWTSFCTNIRIMNSNGSYNTQLSFVYATYPDWSPDGNRIVFTNKNDGRLWIMNKDGSGLKQLTYF